jgi:hypothetical protein
MLSFLQSACAARQTTRLVDTLKKIDLVSAYSVPDRPVNHQYAGTPGHDIDMYPVML